MRIRLGVSPDIDLDTMGEAIDAALEATTVSQVPLIENGKVPDIRKAIRAGKVKWKPEPPGDEHFDDAKTVLSRGWGDCDDLAPWLAASLRASGEAPDAKAFVYQSGPKRWHAVVDRGDGKVLDPSRWAGMGGKKTSIDGVRAASWLPMWRGKLGLAAHPYHRGYAGRVDVPDASLPISWSAITYGPNRAHAIRSAIHGVCGAIDCAGDPYEDDMARLHGLHMMLGAPSDMHVIGSVLDDLEEELGEEGLIELLPAVNAFNPEVGSFFGSIAKGLGKVAKGVAKGAASVATGPLGRAALSFVPGGGAVSTAFDIAKNVIPGMKGGGGGAPAAPGAPPPPPPAQVTSPSAKSMQDAQVRPGTAMALPGGIVLVRF